MHMQISEVHISWKTILKAFVVSVFLCSAAFPDESFHSVSCFMIVMVALCVFFFIMMDQQSNELLNTRSEWLLALLVSFTALLGVYLDRGRCLAYLSTWNRILFFLQVLSINAITVGIIRIVSNCFFRFAGAENDDASNNRVERPVFRVFLTSFLIIFGAWMIVWLAYYPGLWNYDPWQVNQFIDNSYNTYHPLIHTLLLGACYQIGLNIGNACIGVILYDFIQGTVMAAIMALVHSFLCANTRSRSFQVLTLLFFAVHPICSILAISTTKDVLFTGFILLALMIAILLLNREQKKGWLYVAEVFSLVMVSLLRTNGKYILYAMAIVALVLIRKKKWRVFLLILAASIGISTGVELWLTHALKAEREDFQPYEALSIVAQQFGRIYGNTGDLEDQKIIEQYLDTTKIRYNEHLADPVKRHFRYDSDIKEMLKDSAALFWKYKAVSLDSLLYTTEGLWYLQDRSNAEIYGKNNRQGFLLTDIKEGYGIVSESKIPFLEKICEKLFTENRYQSIPVFSLLFSPALYVFLFVFCWWASKAVHGIYDICFFPFLILFLNLFLYPCIMIRYVYPFVACAPLFLWMSMDSVKNSGKGLERK